MNTFTINVNYLWCSIGNLCYFKTVRSFASIRINCLQIESFVPIYIFSHEIHSQSEPVRFGFYVRGTSTLMVDHTCVQHLRLSKCDRIHVQVIKSFPLYQIFSISNIDYYNLFFKL